MGVYIPNKAKPKNCWVCFNDDCNHWGENGYDNSDDCPLEEVDDIAFGLYKAYIDGIGVERRNDEEHR